MITIWKTTLLASYTQQVMLRKGAEILCAREQFGKICIWWRFDSDEIEPEVRDIAICGTGHPAPPMNESRYLGTASLEGGALIFHVFEKVG